MPALQKVTCLKCVELWREYAAATRFHVQLLKEQERLGPSDAPPEIGLAGMRRDTAREGIRMHLAMDHAHETSHTLTAG